MDRSRIVTTNRLDSSGKQIPESMTDMELELVEHIEFDMLERLILRLKENASDEIEQWLLSGFSKYYECEGDITLEDALGLTKRPGWNPFAAKRKLQERDICYDVMEDFILNFNLPYLSAAEVALAYANISNLSPDSLVKERSLYGSRSVAVLEDQKLNLSQRIPHLKHILEKVYENQNALKDQNVNQKSEGYLGAVVILTELMKKIEDMSDR